MKKIILPGLGIGAIVTGLVVVPLVASAIRSTAVEVYQLTPHAPDVVSVNLDMWNFDNPDPAKTADYDRKLMKNYGLPNESKDVLLLVDKSKLVYPAGKDKRPDLVFLPVDKQKGENPLELKTLDFLAPLVRIGALVVGALFLVLWYVLKLRRQKAGAAPAGH